tara:strand:+ start:207 stop:386 length:180 start_codon:yes stop_codon:yes gene_type:complete
MRVLLDNYGDVRIFTERPYGYKRYRVEWSDNTTSIFHGIWYNEKTIREIVEAKLENDTI